MSFEIRSHVPDAALDNAEIQAIYDTINRMVMVVGDIAFAKLFAMPFADLEPILAPRIEAAAAAGLMTRASDALELMHALRKDSPAMTLADCFLQPRQRTSKELLRGLVALRRCGLRVPLPVIDEASEEHVRAAKAFNRFIDAAGHLAFQDLFLKAPSDVGDEAVIALEGVRVVGLFCWWRNDRGCTPPAGPCSARTDAFCSLTHPGPTTPRGECSLASRL